MEEHTRVFLFTSAAVSVAYNMRPTHTRGKEGGGGALPTIGSSA